MKLIKVAPLFLLFLGVGLASCNGGGVSESKEKITETITKTKEDTTTLETTTKQEVTTSEETTTQTSNETTSRDADLPWL